jgi:hypothetical protein
MSVYTGQRENVYPEVGDRLLSSAKIAANQILRGCGGPTRNRRISRLCRFEPERNLRPASADYEMNRSGDALVSMMQAADLRKCSDSTD